MSVGKRVAHAVFVGEYSDDMNMVGHKAIAPDLCLGLVGPFAEQIDVQPVVSIIEEDLISPVSTLGNVAGMTGNYDSR